MSEPEQLTRPRGRPPASEPKSAISAWVPTRLHDRLVALAQRRGDSVSSVVRVLLEQRTK